VICYTDLARYVGPDQPLYGLQDPGLFGQKSFTRVEAMAERYIEALREVQPEGPYRIGGWSFGAIVAYEMAQQLRKEKEDVALLALFDYPPPLQNRRGLPRLMGAVRRKVTGTLFGLVFLLHQKGIQVPGFSLPDSTTMATQVLEEVGRQFGKQLDVSPEALAAAQMGDQAALQEQFEGAGFDMSEDDVEYMLEYGRRYGEVYRRNTEAAMRYVPRPYPHPITLFRVKNVAPEDLEFNPMYKKPLYGWDELSPEVEVYVTSGTHHTILYKPHVKSVAEYLRGCLEAVNDSDTQT
jgi:thioesterase domain-containing protein